MSGDAPSLLTLALIHIIGVISPGPNALIVIRNAMHERKLGFITGLGIMPVGIIWASLSMFGVGKIIKEIPQLSSVLYALCGSYLIWLGIKLVHGSFKRFTLNNIHSGKKPSAREAFVAGFISNLTNPKSIVYWMSVFVATNSTELEPLLKIVAVIFLPITTLIWYCFLSMMVSNRFTQNYLQNQRHWIDRVAGIVITGFGINLLTWLT